MDDALGQTLLRLALHDEHLLEELATAGHARSAADARAALLVQFGALVCLGAETPTFQVVVERALAAGLEADDLLGVLVAVAPMVGTPRVAAGAASLGRALGHDLDGALERHDQEQPGDPRPPAAA